MRKLSFYDEQPSSEACSFGKLKSQEKQQQKLYVTKAISKLTRRQRDKIHKQLLQEKNPNTKTQKQTLYKTPCRTPPLLQISVSKEENKL